MPISKEVTLLTSEIDFSFARSSGAGGQNVNKVNSKAILKWNLTTSRFFSNEIKIRLFALARNKINDQGDLILSSEKFRDQGKNIKECLEKLSDLITQASVPPKRRVPTKKTRSSQRKRLDGKKILSNHKTSRKRVSF
jgi:ribosome-associated protein